MTTEKLIEALNAPLREDRLSALRALQALLASGALPKPPKGIDINNHIHTTYSFSPYSPAKAVWMAYQAGLQTAGIIDHDSVSGAEEFLEAGKILGLPATIGFEMRVSFEHTPFSQSCFNNPDQKGNAYFLVHGIPHNMIARADAFLAPVREARLVRLRAMATRLQDIAKPFGIDYDFDRDSLPLSMAHEGGGVTERHLLFGFSHALIKRFGQSGALLAFIRDSLNIAVSPKVASLLQDAANPYYAYDLLGALKSGMVESIYLRANGAECPPFDKLIAFAKGIGAIPCYAYLGDVGDSVTGDKKTQAFEDAILDELAQYLSDIGLQALAYMPTRNTLAQLLRVQALCQKHQFLEICGEDINQPRQAFICEALRKDEFKHLIDATWALIGHENAATLDPADGFFGAKAIGAYPELSARIAAYAKMGGA